MGVSPNIPLKGQKKFKKWLKKYWAFTRFFWEQNLSLFSFKILRINIFKKSENRYRNIVQSFICKIFQNRIVKKPYC